MGDSLQKLQVWSTLHSLQEAQEVGEYPFHMTQLICASSRQLLWFPSLPCSLACLSMFFTSLHVGE